MKVELYLWLIVVISFLLLGSTIFNLQTVTAASPSATETFAESGDDVADGYTEKVRNYSVKLHGDEPDKPRPVLLLYSVPKDDETRQKRQIDLFAQIIESHWHANITIKDFKEVQVREAVAWPQVILVEQNASEVAAEHYAKIVSATDGKTMWIGCGSSALGGNIQPEIKTDPIKHVTYRDTTFSTEPSLVLCDSFLENNEEIVDLASYTSEAGSAHPFIGVYKDNHLIAPFLLPNWYEISSYSLPFLDTIHSFLGHHENANKLNPALLRLEDVNVGTYASGRELNRVYNFLRERDVPFHLAFIVRYIHPLAGIDMLPSDSRRFLFTIKRMLENEDAVLIQHGYTHQVGNEISGEGFEFWNGPEDKPLEFSSIADAHKYPLERIVAAQKTMREMGLPVPDIWETPHYAHSDIDHNAFNFRYPIRYETIPEVGVLPFTAKIDGTVYIPETLGYIFHGPEQLDEKKQLIAQLSTFEDGVASVFWHPWRDLSELRALVDLIEGYGYTFVKAYDLVEVERQRSIFTPIASAATIIASDALIYTLFAIFILGAFWYMRNIWRVTKYLRQIKRFSISLPDIYRAAAEHKTDLPTIALFVPARNEGLVIGNTLRRISKLEYPKSKLAVFVIVDERELDDDVPQTTKAVAREVIRSIHVAEGRPYIRVIEIPKWYSGVYNNRIPTYARSTKGRALNYCLQSIDISKIDMIGVLDADGRLSSNVLKEVAYNRITKGSKLLQGPVFQVSNFKDVSIVGKAAGLELALHHLTELPHQLHKPNKLQFLAGTNYFIDTKSITEAGGWDQNALVEDAEIALRLYLKERTVGDWLNSPEIEQTPANFSVYFKQRERWVRGHLQLVDQIKNSGLPWTERWYLYYKIVIAQARFLFDVGVPALAITMMLTGALTYIPPALSYLSIALFIISIGIWDTYGFMYRNLKPYIDPEASVAKLVYMSLKHMLFFPIFIIVQTLPRLAALYHHFFSSKERSWYKTERTPEAVTH